MPKHSDSKSAATKKLKTEVAQLTKALKATIKYALKGRAFSEKDELKIKAAMGPYVAWAGSWKCGDYICTGAGTVYKVGDTSEIAFTSGVCPKNATLGDGSLWRAAVPCNCHSC
jgi:hypothetical protein